jgi:hypothetical protein
MLAVALTKGELIGIAQIHLSPGVFSHLWPIGPPGAGAGVAWSIALLTVALSPVVIGLLADGSTFLLNLLRRVLTARTRASKESARKP